MSSKTTYSKFPWYALRQNYCDAITLNGGIPVAVPHDISIISDILKISDGLVITGGAFDINPSYFSSININESLVTKEKRTKFELTITEEALIQDKAILGICGGEQLLNVVYGGSLIQDINNEVKNPIQHEQENPRDQTSHKVNIIPDTKLKNIVNSSEIFVNSAHHQSIDKKGTGLVINAEAPDGVIEGIEDPNKNFCLGVQWHPEFLITKEDENIFSSFIKASSNNRKNEN